MAKLELSEETKAGIEEVKEADLLIAVAVPVDAEQLRAAATQAVLGMGQPAFLLCAPWLRFPAVRSPRRRPGRTSKQTETGGALRFVPYSLPAGSPSRIPWLPAASTYQALFAMARDLGVSACAVIGLDLAALHSNFLASDDDAGTRKALRTCHAPLCLGKVRRPAELEHPCSAHPRALWAAGAFSFGAGLLSFGQDDSRSGSGIAANHRPGTIHLLAGNRGCYSRLRQSAR